MFDIDGLKGVAIQISAASRIQRFFGPPVDSRITTLLFHRFFFKGESRNQGRERLRRQLEWLRSEYTPISLSQAADAFSGGKLPKRAALVTVDDGYTDLLELTDVFKAFDVPVGLFVCAGWSAQASPSDWESLLVRVVTAIEWYEGPSTSVVVGDGSLSVHLDRADRAEAIEHLLRSQDEFSRHLEELAVKLDELSPKRGRSTICNWRELTDLRNYGVQIGSHSVSHIRLAKALPRRLAFEIGEGKRLLQTKLGDCFAFAYPYGVDGTYNDETTSLLKTSGFQLAFLTHPDFASVGTDPYHLPRVVIPDQNMSHAEFRARVMGGGIALRKIGRLFRTRHE